MSVFSKARRYARKLDRLSGEFMGYMEENPLVAVGLTLAVGTMASAMSGGMSGGKAEDGETRSSSRRRRRAA
jgi:hypothetical protein